MTITRDEMLAPMRTACPGWGYEVDEDDEDAPLYLALYDLAWYIWQQLLVTDRDTLKPAFAVIESWLMEGDEQVKQACSVGVLETLKHARGAKQPEARRMFVDLLGPVARKKWDTA
jgi:hypothetical protein